MSVVFGSARIDEHGKIKGGAAGDQTGGEVSTQAYYTSAKGWVGLRAYNSTVADKLAEAMQQACDNPRIGYDQNQRLGVIIQLAIYGSLKAISGNTECDCSSLVRACVIQATGKDPGNFNTATEKATLLRTGLFKEVKITKADDCRTGDILVTKVKGHTGIITSGNILGIAIPTVKKGSKGSNAKILQHNLNQCGYDLKEDGDFGKLSTAALVRWQYANKLSADGIYGPKSYAKMKEILNG